MPKKPVTAFMVSIPSNGSSLFQYCLLSLANLTLMNVSIPSNGSSLFQLTGLPFSGMEGFGKGFNPLKRVKFISIDGVGDGKGREDK